MRSIEEIRKDIDTSTANAKKAINIELQIAWEERARRAEMELRAALSASIPLDRLEAICNAERDGRCVVLPNDTVPACKGHPRPLCHYNDTRSPWCMGLSHGGNDEPIDTCKECWYLCLNAEDRAEAEAAKAQAGATSHDETPQWHHTPRGCG